MKEVRPIPLAVIHADPGQPRKDFDEEALSLARDGSGRIRFSDWRQSTA